jgi:hypothetical protein
VVNCVGFYVYTIRCLQKIVAILFVRSLYIANPAIMQVLFGSEAFRCSNRLRDVVMCQVCMGCFITYITAFFNLSLA